jgi:hypothetical protein
VHAELVHGYGIVVGHNTMNLLMRRAALAGPARAIARQADQEAGHGDRPGPRDFRRTGPDPTWRNCRS